MIHLDGWNQSLPPINRIRICHVHVWQYRFHWCDYLIITASAQLRELQRHRCSMLARRALACDTAPSAPQVRTRHLLARPRLGNTLKCFKTRVFEHFFSTGPENSMFPQNPIKISLINELDQGLCGGAFCFWNTEPLHLALAATSVGHLRLTPL